MMEVVKGTPAYAAIVERAIHRDESSFSAIEVATHWHEHFRAVASSNEKILNDQAVCFFQIAQGAELGTLILGRKGAPTRFEFSTDGLQKFGMEQTTISSSIGNGSTNEDHEEDESAFTPPLAPPTTGTFNNKVFITHGKNKKVLDQIKEIVSYGNYQPVIAQENETVAKPVPEKVMDDMRTCSAAVIHVGSEGVYRDASGKERPKINDNVLIEIGAAMALYKRNFILVVEEGLDLPSNLQGLYQCRYAGDELGMEATMKLLKAFKEFRE
jgi:predicted nucleotide-binding protein